MNDYQKELMTWKCRRRYTTIFATVHVFFAGVKGFAIATSLMYYLRDSVKVANPTYWYGVVLTSIILSEALTSLFFGRYMDKTRNCRGIMLFNLSFSLLGHVMYTLPYSVWMLVCGRFLCGFGESIQPVIVGEFRRCYDDKEFSKVVSRYQLSYSFGYIFGPALSTLLAADIKFTLFTWHVNRYNAIGLVLAFFELFLIVFAYIFVFDISKEYDLIQKKQEKQSYIQSGNQEETSVKKLSNEKIWGLRDFIAKDILHILLPFILSRFTLSLGEPVIYLFLINQFEWSIDELVLSVFTVGLLCSISTMILVKMNVITGKHRIFYLFLSSLSGISMLQLLYVLPTVVDIQSFSMEVLYFVFTDVLYIHVYFIMNTSVRYILLNMVPSHSASSMDGFRGAVATIGRMVGTFSSSYVFFCGGYILPPLSGVMTIVLFSLIYNRRKFTC